MSRARGGAAFAVAAAVCFAFSAASSAAAAEGEGDPASSSVVSSSASAPPDIQALQSRSAAIGRRSASLLERLEAERRRLLDQERAEILEQLDRWRRGEEDMEAAAYHRELERALEIAESYGVDVERMRSLHELMKKTILRMDFVNPDDTGLGTWNTITDRVYNFFDWANGEEERIARAQEQRVKMYKNGHRFFIQALLEKDPELALQKFEQYFAALRDMQLAEGEQLLVEAQRIVDAQRLVVDISAGIPGWGEFMDAYALYYGEDLAGHQLSGFEKGFTAFFLVGIPVIGQVVKRAGPSVKAGLGKLVATVDDATAARRAQLAELLGVGVEEISAMINRLKEFDELQPAIAQGRRALTALRELHEAVLRRIEEMRQAIARLRGGTEVADDATRQFEELIEETRRALDEGNLPAEEAERLRRQLEELRNEFAQELTRAAVRDALGQQMKRLETILDAARRQGDLSPETAEQLFDAIAGKMRERLRQLPEDEAARFAQRIDDMKRELTEQLDALREAQRGVREAFEQSLSALRGSLDEFRNGNMTAAEFLNRLKETQNHLKNLGPEEAARLGEQLRAVEAEFMEAVDRAAREAVENSDELSALQNAWRAGEAAALEKVSRIQELIAAGRANLNDPDFLDAYMAIRSDKRALTELKELGEEYLTLRTQIREFEDALLRQVDAETMADIRMVLKGGADELSESARRRLESEIKRRALEAGVPPSALAGKSLDELVDLNRVDIDTFKATNKPPAPDDLGMDRDITFQLNIREVAGHNVNMVVDVPADAAARSYHGNLYQNLHPGEALPTGSSLHEWGAETMDHVVTDHLVADAYRFDADIRDFLADPRVLAGEARQIDDFANTVFYKSDEWFERGQRLTRQAREAAQRGLTDQAQRLHAEAMSNMVEGTRQAHKQYTRYMSALAETHRMNLASHIPAHVRQGMDIFGKLKNRQMSYPEAQAALRQLGVTPTDVVRDFADHFRMILKLEDSARTGFRQLQQELPGVAAR